MEYIVEFGSALIVILIAAMVFWGIHWKNEVLETIALRNKLKKCQDLPPIQFSTKRKTDIITIESLQYTNAVDIRQKRRRESTARHQ